MTGAVPLSEIHRRMLEVESGISTDIIAARGYRTVTDSNELTRAGFAPRQAKLAPGLLVPIHTPDGGNGLYRFRPDQPRQVKRRGKLDVLKYEQPKGAGLRLDCNPLARPHLTNPRKPIAFVEGEKKADALLSRGLAAIALPGTSGFKGRNAFGGVTLSADFDYIALDGRTAYIIFDSDAADSPQVSAMEARLAEHLRRKGAQVKIIRIPPGPDGQKVGADDYLAAGHVLDELLALSVDEPRTLHMSFAQVRSDGLPGIRTNGRHLRDVSTDGLSALSKANQPAWLFVRGGALSVVTIDEKQRPRIDLVTEARLRGRLARVANFYSEREANGLTQATPQDPPLAVVRDLLELGSWPFPALESIVECPTLRPDGTVITQPGYDPDTGVFYYPDPGLQLEPVPVIPTADQVHAARELLLEAFGDFPYVDEAAQANALAAVLTPIYRPAILGPVPLGLVDAPQQGTGKGLFAEAVADLATGRSAALMTAPRDDDEWRKQITSTLLTGAPIITVDNLTGTLYSGVLAAALTSATWSDRVLGSTKIVNVAQRATWLATGNNIKLGGDLPRRCYWIRMDAKLSRPWMRTGFRHPHLAAWILANRGRLLAAALTLARAWYAAGCPVDPAAPALGTFTEWARVMGGVLAFIGVRGFLGNLEALYEIADVDGPAWEVFLQALHDHYQGRPVLVSEIATDLAGTEELLQVVPEMLSAVVDDKGQPRQQFKVRLGHALRDRRGTRFGERHYRVDQAGEDRDKAKKWRFVCGGCGGCGGSTTPVKGEGVNESIKLRIKELKGPGGETSSASSATSALPVKCSACGSTSNWLNGAGESVCATCHPPAPGGRRRA